MTIDSIETGPCGPTRLSRRAVLRGAGGITIALPWLELMATGPARASGAPRFPRRFVPVFISNGTLPARWKPTGEGASFKLSEILAPLEAYRNDIAVIIGLRNEAGLKGQGFSGHVKGMGSMLSGVPNMKFSGGFDGAHGGGISLDQFLSRRLGPTRFPSIELGVSPGSKGNVLERMCYSGPGKPVHPESKALNVFKRVFAGGDAAIVDRTLEQRRSVLDAVLGRYQSFRARLGSADRERLDEHLTALRALEARLSPAPAPTAGGCKTPPAPQTAGMGGIANEGRAFMDLIALVMACDLSRVMSLQWGPAGWYVTFPHLGISDAHHTLGHKGDSDADAQNKLKKIGVWYSEQFAYLLGRLKAVKEGDGTLLDNTALFWFNEISKGNTHSMADLPLVVAGRAGGALKMGQVVRTSGAHNRLLVTLMNALGVPGDSFGDASVGQARIRELLV
jgi:hypothetical protein